MILLCEIGRVPFEGHPPFALPTSGSTHRLGGDVSNVFVGFYWFMCLFNESHTNSGSPLQRHTDSEI
jgi:hypothetical protein